MQTLTIVLFRTLNACMRKHFTVTMQRLIQLAALINLFLQPGLRPQKSEYDQKIPQTQTNPWHR